MVNLALAWAEAYQAVQPNTRIAVTGGGSGTGWRRSSMARPTLPMPAARSNKKIDRPRQTTSRRSNTSPRAMPSPSSFTHRIPSNTSRSNKSRIFTREKLPTGSRSAARNAPSCCCRASQLGHACFLFGTSYPFGQLEKQRLFAPETLLLPSSEGITAEVRQNPNTIGYDGLGYVTPDVKMLAVAHDDSGAVCFAQH